MMQQLVSASYVMTLGVIEFQFTLNLQVQFKLHFTYWEFGEIRIRYIVDIGYVTIADKSNFVLFLDSRTI